MVVAQSNPDVFGAGHRSTVAGAAHDSAACTVPLAAQKPLAHALHTAPSEHELGSQLPPLTTAEHEVTVPHKPLIFVEHEVPLLSRQNSVVHVVQTVPGFVPPEHDAHPGYAALAAAHFCFGFRHGVLVDVSHCVQSPLLSHGLAALHPVDAWHVPSFWPKQ